MHTILTDFGRSYAEITDAEWDIRTVPAAHEKMWTYTSAWYDHLTSHGRLLNEHLAQPRTYLVLSTPSTTARALMSEVANQEHEMELRGRCPHP